MSIIIYWLIIAPNFLSNISLEKITKKRTMIDWLWRSCDEMKDEIGSSELGPETADGLDDEESGDGALRIDFGRQVNQNGGAYEKSNCPGNYSLI